jgi:chaperonin GroES
MSVRMLEGRVLVKCPPIPDRSPGGIIIPDVAKEPPIEGVVVAVGPGKLRADGTRARPEVQVGERVIFGPYIGSMVKIEAYLGPEAKDDGETYKVVFEDNLEAVYEGTPLRVESARL